MAWRLPVILHPLVCLRRRHSCETIFDETRTNRYNTVDVMVTLTSDEEQVEEQHSGWNILKIARVLKN